MYWLSIYLYSAPLLLDWTNNTTGLVDTTHYNTTTTNSLTGAMSDLARVEMAERVKKVSLDDIPLYDDDESEKSGAENAGDVGAQLSTSRDSVRTARALSPLGGGPCGDTPRPNHHRPSLFNKRAARLHDPFARGLRPPPFVGTASPKMLRPPQLNAMPLLPFSNEFSGQQQPSAFRPIAAQNEVRRQTRTPPSVQLLAQRHAPLRPAPIGHAPSLSRESLSSSLRAALPMRSGLCEGGGVTYPLIYVSPAGTISIVLHHDVLIEMTVDRSVRVVCHDNFAVCCNARGTSSSILHPNARILHAEDKVYSKFSSTNDKMAVFGGQGVLFTMSHLAEAYLVSAAALRGASAVALDQLQFPVMENDYTVKLFYTEAQTGQQFIAMCKEIVHEATYDRRPDGSLTMHVNGMLVRQSSSGDVVVDARPRQISCSPAKSTVHVRSSFIDMAVQDEEKAFVKRGVKRVHVSRSGMVVSDGNSITSMDHFGRIVSCT